MHRSTDLWGWILFLLCAVVFVAVGIRDGDALMTLGSALFLAACVLFLVPYVVGGEPVHFVKRRPLQWTAIVP